MTKFKIDYMYGIGSGCEKLFDTIDDAKRHMNLFYTAEERKDLTVVDVILYDITYFQHQKSYFRLPHKMLWDNYEL